MADIIIPRTVISIGYEAFRGCDSLYIFAEVEKAPSSWDPYWNYDCLPVIWGYVSDSVSDTGFKYVVSYTNSVYSVIILGYTGSLSEIVIPDTIEGHMVKGIEAHAFEDCSSITSITIPESVTDIGKGAFLNCRGLVSITILGTINKIDDTIFSGCNNLTTVTVLGIIVNIESYAFSNFTSLKSFTIQGNYQYHSVINSYAFSGCGSLERIFIPNNYTTVGYNVFLNCYKLTIFTEVESFGDQKDWNYNWNPNIRPVFWGYVSTNVSDDGLEYIICCLNSTSYVAIIGYKGTQSEIIIPETIEGHVVGKIGAYAFFNCSNLTSIIIPINVSGIGEYAFSGCSHLTIYAEASIKPSGWVSTWNSSNRPVVWGYTE